MGRCGGALLRAERWLRALVPAVALLALGMAGVACGPPVLPEGPGLDTSRSGDGRVAGSRPPVGRTGMRIVASDMHSEFGKETTVVVRSPLTWAELRPSFPNAPDAVPEIDFDEEMVLVAALGPKPTGGYEVSIESVRPVAEGGLRAHVRVVEPGEGCMVTQARTSPAVAVAVERRDAGVEFVQRVEEGSCE